MPQVCLAASSWPVIDLPGFVARSIYLCPLDGKNPNRVFPGDAGGTGSEQIADWLFRNVISQADCYGDLHGGDLIEALVSFTIFFRSGDEQADARSLEMAKIFGIDYLVASGTPGSTISAAAGAGIPAILTSRADRASGRRNMSLTTRTGPNA